MWVNDSELVNWTQQIRLTQEIGWFIPKSFQNHQHLITVPSSNQTRQGNISNLRTVVPALNLHSSTQGCPTGWKKSHEYVYCIPIIPSFRWFIGDYSIYCIPWLYSTIFYHSIDHHLIYGNYVLFWWFTISQNYPKFITIIIIIYLSQYHHLSYKNYPSGYLT